MSKSLAVIFTVLSATTIVALQIYLLGWWYLVYTACIIGYALAVQDWFLYQSETGQWVTEAWFLIFAIPIAGLHTALIVALAGMCQVWVHRYMYKKAGLGAYLTY